MDLLHDKLRLQHTLAGVAIFFGLLTLGAGGSVLMGWRDPGYIVFMPLLVYNLAMGFAYIAAGLLGWRDAGYGEFLATMILLGNMAMLALIVVVYVRGGGVALHSLRAMTFRTLLWLGLYLGFRWLGREEARRLS